MSTYRAVEFVVYAVAFYAAHHVGDYWVQTDHQARHKGDAGWPGVQACTKHVASYLLTQAVFAVGAAAMLGLEIPVGHLLAGLAVSGVTHFLADRREHGVMLRLARLIPGKADFLKLGVPRSPSDNPSLGTGAWALDQAWHVFWGVFVAALIVAV